MEDGIIQRELQIDAAPEVVFEVLSRPEHIRQWWSAETEFEPVAGTAGSFTWTDTEADRVDHVPFTLVEVDPPRLLAFRWCYDNDVPGPGNSLLVRFELVPSAAGTTIRFTETGFRERGWEAATLEAQYNDHRQGWDFYLPRLVTLADRVAAA